MSQYLLESKPLLRKMVNRLAEDFEYVSVLGTDTAGKTFTVRRTGEEISDTFWNERGYVFRLYNGAFYSEFSINNINEDNLEEKLEEIKSSVQNQFKAVKASGIHLNEYPVMEEEQISQFYYGSIEDNYEGLSYKDKLERMESLKDNMLKKSELLIDAMVSYKEVHVSKIFLSNKKDLEQSYIWSEGYLVAIAKRDKTVKYAVRGYSGLKSIQLLADMEKDIEEVVQEAIELLDSKPVVPGEYDVICSPEVAGLIAHEAFGHGVEMDMFVKNRAKAAEYLGKPVASPLVRMHDGAAAAKHVSTYLFDDEGSMASDTVIIDNGILKTGINDLMSAMKLNIPATGNGKRESFERKAYSRMTNTFFGPGKDKLEDMISSIEYGFLLKGMESGMEDPKNWGIQCIITKGLEIKNGKLTGKVVSPVIMTGYVPDVLQSITMVSDDFELFGNGACGKGHKERAKTSDGGPYMKLKARLG